MPLAQNNALPTTVSLTTADNNGLTAASGAFVPRTWSDAQVGNFFVTLIAAFEALTVGRVTNGSRSLQFEQTDNNIVAAPSAEVERKLFIPLAGAGNARVLFSVPAPTFNIEQVGTNVVDPADPLVAALITALLTGGPLSAGIVSNQGVPMSRLDGTPYIGHETRRKAR